MKKIWKKNRNQLGAMTISYFESLRSCLGRATRRRDERIRCALGSVIRVSNVTVSADSRSTLYHQK